MRGRGNMLVWLAAVVMAAAATAAGAVDDACQVPESLTYVDAPLPRVAERLAGGGPIRVDVYGTASSAGAGVSAPASTYAVRLAGELSRRFEGIQVSVANRSRRNRTAAEMAATIGVEVLPDNPVLVIWQTGTTDAVRGIDVNEFGEALDEGIRALHAAGADVVLMDPQYSARTSALVSLERYAEYMQWATRSSEAILFPRLEIMKHWVENGVVAFDDTSKAAQRRAADFVHGCIAQLLGEMIERSARFVADPPDRR